VLFSDAVARLEDALRRPLPGPSAQALMAPRARREWPPGFDPARARAAAGLLLLYPIDALAHIARTVRSAHVRHSGQVSLPGGVVEPGETFEQTALRESHEEIALDTRPVCLLGRLTPIDIPVSGFRLHPLVATLTEQPVLRPSDLEVDRILEVSLATLLDPATTGWHVMQRDDRPFEVPGFAIGSALVWGATAMLLAEFLTLLGWHGPKHD
jgi:8-oxo-dGTP pyrophosphatase MutT (NUDIX family)